MSLDKPMDGIQAIDRSDVPGVRRTLTLLGAVVAEVDEQLRYVWIDNSHPDFDGKSVIGLRDDELVSKTAAQEIMAIKRQVFQREAPISAILGFGRSSGTCYYSLCAYPIRGVSGRIDGLLTVAFDAPSRTATTNVAHDATETQRTGQVSQP